MTEASSITDARLYAASADDVARVARVRASGMLDAGCAELDELARRAAQIMGTPIAAVSVLLRDDQHFIATSGPELPSMDRATSFCTHVTADRMLVIGDLGRHPAFAMNPHVHEAGLARTYCGAPITSDDGHVLAVLCTIDPRAREFDEAQLEQFAQLAAEVRALLLPASSEAHRLAVADVLDDLGDPLLAWLEHELPDLAALEAHASMRTGSRRWRVLRRGRQLPVVTAA